MLIARNYYLPLMAAMGIVLGALVVKDPDLQQLAFPPLLWLIGVSLLFDLTIFSLAKKTPVMPLTTNHRFMGVALGGALFFAITYFFAPPPVAPPTPAPQKTGVATTVAFG